MRDLCEDCTKFSECISAENPPEYVTLWSNERPETCSEFNELEIVDPRIKRLSELFEFCGRCAVVEQLEEHREVIEPLFFLRELVDAHFGRFTKIILSVESDIDFVGDDLVYWLEAFIKSGKSPDWSRIQEIERTWCSLFYNKMIGKLNLRWEF